MNFVSKTDDVIWLYYKLKDEIGEKISVNELGLYQEVLSGKYYKDKTDFRDRGINFGIKYSENEFLRITIGEYQLDKTYEEKLNALFDLYNVISKIQNKNGELIGEPLALYNVYKGRIRTPYLEWAFTKQDEYIKQLQDDTLFDDGSIKDLVLFNQLKLEPNLNNKQLKK